MTMVMDLRFSLRPRLEYLCDCRNGHVCNQAGTGQWAALVFLLWDAQSSTLAPPPTSQSNRRTVMRSGLAGRG